MSKKIYVGVENTAKRIKKIYIGIDEEELGAAARRVKKAYIGVNNKAKCCFGEEELKYYNSLTLPDGDWDLSGGTLGNKCIIGGGWDWGKIWLYDSSFSCLELGESYGQFLEGVSFANYPKEVAVFAGGENSVTATYYNTVLSYDKSATAQYWPNLSEPKAGASGGYLGDSDNKKIFFIGGEEEDGLTYSGDIEIYSLSGTKELSSNGHSKAYGNLAITKNRIFFGGGIDENGITDVVPVYDQNLTYVRNKFLEVGRVEPQGTVFNSNAFFIGGYSNLNRSAPVDNFDYFNESLTQGYGTLSRNRGEPGVVSFDENLLIAGGLTGTFSNPQLSKTAEKFDASLTLTLLDSSYNLSLGKFKMASVKYNGYGIFAGGCYLDENLNFVSRDTIDIYTA